MKILIVDDSRIQRNILTNLFKEHNITNIVTADNGDTALQVLDKNKDVNLILLDWNMPKVSGIKFMKIMRMSEHFKDIPVIMVTSEADRRYVEDAVKAGVNDYIIKPINASLLWKKISSLLNL